MNRRIAHARGLLEAEDGIAIVVAMAALLVVLLLSTAVFAAATQLSGSVNRDEDGKRAFQAADAGIDTVVYRFNNSVSGSTQNPYAFCAKTATCTGTVPLAEGASASYTIGPVSTSGVCAGQPFQVTSAQARCVTSIGTADGITKRIQAQLSGTVSSGAATLFPVPGLLGLTNVNVNNGRIYTKETNGTRTAGYMGSNGQVTISQPIDNELYVNLGASAPTSGNPTTGNQNKPVHVVRQTSDYTASNSAIPIGSTATSNLNADSTAYASSGGNTRNYTASTRAVTFDNGTFTFKKSGDYNFCSFLVNNTTNFNFSSTSIKVRIFIDSPTRTGSGCPANTGTFKSQNGMNVSGTADQFQVYVWGPDVNGSPAVDFVNSGTNNMFIYAPLATVHFGNSQTFTGGITANKIKFDNAFDFVWDKSVTPPTGTGGASDATSFSRYAWRECPASGNCV